MKYLNLITSFLFISLLFLSLFTLKVHARDTNFNWPCEVGFKKDYTNNTCNKVNVPENAHLSWEGDDFECEHGFKRLEDECERIVLPENAVLDATGHDFSCIDTYIKDGDKCTKVELPDNAHFFIKGADFFCDNQYQKEGNKCVKFDIPDNAHLNFMGDDFICNFGYTKNDHGDKCEVIIVPLRATANSLGNFNCDPGFEKVGNECKELQKRDNAHFYENSIDFYCDQGFKKSNQNGTCDKIVPPENGRLDSVALDGWICNEGYAREGNSCTNFDLPAHSHWEKGFFSCDLGYKKSSDLKSCEEVSIPEHAHAVNTFDGWNCDNGYTKNYQDNRCDAI